MIDIKQRFGKTFQVKSNQSTEQVWYNGNDEIACQHGRIYLQDASTLGAIVRGPGISDSIRSLPGVAVLEERPDFVRLSFPPNVFPQVALILGARKRKGGSERGGRSLRAKADRTGRKRHKFRVFGVG